MTNITKDEIISKAKKAKEAFYEWKKDHIKGQVFCMILLNNLEKTRRILQRTATIEMGKAIKEARVRSRKMCLGNRIFCR